MSEKKLGFLLGNLFYAYASYMNSYLKEMDLTLSQTRILLVLALNGGISIYELSKATNIGKSSITKSVKILEKKGFLTKEIDSQDNRKKYIKITPKGLEVQKLAVRMNDEIENKINEEFGENEINELKEKLEQLIGIIKVP